MSVSWENEVDAQKYEEALPLSPRDLRILGDGPTNAGGELEFDSQDEDECEDLFAGVWSRQLAAKRRQRKKERFGRRPVGDLLFGAGSSNDTLA